MARKKNEGRSGPRIPECMTTFADMITLMVTFFILLCSFAKSQDAEFFADGVGSFRRAIESMGLPGIMFSNTTPVTLGETLPGHERSRRPGDQEFWLELNDRLIEESPELLRDALLSSMQADRDVLLPGRTWFARGSAVVPGEASAQLAKLAEAFRNTDLTIEILAYSDGDEPSLVAGLELAARRARAVGRFFMDVCGLDPGKIEYSGLKPPKGGATIKQPGSEIFFRLKRG